MVIVSNEVSNFISNGFEPKAQASDCSWFYSLFSNTGLCMMSRSWDVPNLVISDIRL